MTAYGLAAVGLGFANPVWLTAVQQEVPAAALARVSAHDWLVFLGAQLLGYAAGPILAHAAGFTWPLSGAAILVVITLLVPASLPSVRDLAPPERCSTIRKTPAHVAQADLFPTGARCARASPVQGSRVCGHSPVRLAG